MGCFCQNLEAVAFLTFSIHFPSLCSQTSKHQYSTGIPLQRASAQSLTLFLLVKCTFPSRFPRQLYSFSLSSFTSGLIPPLLIPSISWSSKSMSLSPRTATDGVLWQVRARETGIQRDWLRVESHLSALSTIEGLSKRFLAWLSRAHQGWQSDGQILPP